MTAKVSLPIFHRNRCLPTFSCKLATLAFPCTVCLSAQVSFSHSHATTVRNISQEMEALSLCGPFLLGTPSHSDSTDRRSKRVDGVPCLKGSRDWSQRSYQRKPYVSIPQPILTKTDLRMVLCLVLKLWGKRTKWLPERPASYMSATSSPSCTSDPTLY